MNVLSSVIPVRTWLFLIVGQAAIITDGQIEVVACPDDSFSINPFHIVIIVRRCLFYIIINILHTRNTFEDVIHIHIVGFRIFAIKTVKLYFKFVWNNFFLNKPITFAFLVEC